MRKSRQLPLFMTMIGCLMAGGGGIIFADGPTTDADRNAPDDKAGLFTSTVQEKNDLVAIAPDELRHAHDKLGGPMGQEFASTVLNLLKATGRNLVDVSSNATTTDGGAKLEQALDAHRAAWGIAIEFLKATNDEGARHLIRQEWDAGMARGKFIETQASALAMHWDPDLFSKDLVSQFQKTNTNKHLLNAVAYILANYGTDDQETLLTEKMDSLPDKKEAQIIANAYTWRLYLHSDQKEPGPTHGEPPPW